MVQLPQVLPLPQGKKSNTLLAPEYIQNQFSNSNNQMVSDLVRRLTKAGVVKEIQMGKTNRVIVSISDVHGHPEAQNNIADLILNVLEAYPSARVGLEGAVGRIPLETFRGESLAMNKEVGSFFLNTELITGAEYAGFAAASTPVFWGMEDKKLYLENVAAVKDALPRQKRQLEAIQSEQNILQNKKAREYSKEMLRLDQAWRQYHQGQMGLGEYVEVLGSIDKVRSHRVGDVIPLFQNILALEKALHFELAEKERNAFLQVLAGRLSLSQTKALLAQSVALKSGDMSYPAYFENLNVLATKAGARLEGFPEFKKYMAYVLQADDIRPEMLLKEVHQLEEDVWRHLCRTPEQKDNYENAVRLQLTEKLVRFTLTPLEWKEYKETFPNPATPRRGGEFESFYHLAEARNAVFSTNLLKQMRDSKSDVAVLVAGGFHSDGVKDLLKDDATIIVVTPKLTEVENDHNNDYLTVFTREKTPLETLFEAPKISLVKPLATGSFGGDENALAIKTLARELPAVFKQANRSGKAIRDLGEFSIMASKKDGPINAIGSILLQGKTRRGIQVVLFRKRAAAFLDTISDLFQSIFSFFLGITYMVNPRKTRSRGSGQQSLSKSEIKGYRIFSEKLMHAARTELASMVNRYNGARYIRQERKGDGSLVTEADTAIQEKVLQLIQATYPTHYVLGEEIVGSEAAFVNLSNKNSDYVWIIDPIDGTKSFSRGESSYAISLALYFRGKPVTAVVWSPAFGMLAASEDRQGVYKDGEILSEQNNHDLDASRITAGLFGESSLSVEIENILRDSYQVDPVNESIKSVVVRGGQLILEEIDILVCIDEFASAKVWDVAAIAYLMKKAGLSMQVILGDANFPALERISQNKYGSPGTNNEYRFMAGRIELVNSILSQISNSEDRGGAWFKNPGYRKWAAVIETSVARVAPIVGFITYHFLTYGNLSHIGWFGAWTLVIGISMSFWLMHLFRGGGFSGILRNRDVTTLTFWTFLSSLPLLLLASNPILVSVLYLVFLVPLTFYHHHVDNPMEKNNHAVGTVLLLAIFGFSPFAPEATMADQSWLSVLSVGLVLIVVASYLKKRHGSLKRENDNNLGLDALVDKIEQLAGPLDLPPGIPTDLDQKKIIDRFSDYYKSILDVLNIHGVFEDSTVIYPASGIDGFPAIYAPTIAFDWKSSYVNKQTILEFMGMHQESNVGAIEANFSIQGADVVQAKNWMGLSIVKEVKGKKIILLKGIYLQALQAAHISMDSFLDQLNAHLSPGDQVLVLDNNDIQQSREWFERNNWRDALRNIPAKISGRMETAIRKVAYDQKNMEQRVYVRYSATRMAVPTALFLYEKPSPSAPSAGKKDRANVVGNIVRNLGGLQRNLMVDGFNFSKTKSLLNPVVNRVAPNVGNRFGLALLRWWYGLSVPFYANNSDELPAHHIVGFDITPLLGSSHDLNDAGRITQEHLLKRVAGFAKRKSNTPDVFLVRSNQDPLVPSENLRNALAALAADLNISRQMALYLNHVVIVVEGVETRIPLQVLFAKAVAQMPGQTMDGLNFDFYTTSPNAFDWDGSTKNIAFYSLLPDLLIVPVSTFMKAALLSRTHA